jgi:predicted secreted protein with PEFG-CTERM motif
MQLYAKTVLSLIFGLIILSSTVPFIPQKAYGDGFTQENVQANIGNRVITVFIKLSPPIITSDTSGDKFIQLRFFDANTNMTINNVAFFVNVTKQDKILMHDLFYTHSGFMILKLHPGDCPQAICTVYGDQNPTLGGWMSQTDEVTILSPILTEGGLYHLNMAILALDYANTLVDQSNPPKFDSYLSVGDVSNQNVTYQNNLYNTTLISYYDKTADFKFDESTKQFSWKMPFDWDVNRFQDRPIFIHEELRVPKSLSAFSDTPTYTASAEGFGLTGRRVIVDPYTVGDYMIVHLFLNKPDLVNMAKTIPSGEKNIEFKVAPEKPNVQSSASLLTDFGGWHIKLGWNPTNLAANSQNNLKISFYDSFTEQQVTGDVNYDIQILDKDQSVLWSKTDAVAQKGSDTQTINLPGNGIYSIIVKVKSIVNNGFPDNSRIGMGRGNVVIPSIVTEQDSLTQSSGQPIDATTGNNATVPEFGPVASIVLAIAVLSVVVFAAKTRVIPRL